MSEKLPYSSFLSLLILFNVMIFSCIHFPEHDMYLFCSSRWPGTCYIDQAAKRSHKDWPVSALQVLGLKVCITMLSPLSRFLVFT